MEGAKLQIAKLINKSNNILVATPEDINGDALGGALALCGALGKLNKNAQFIVPEEVPDKFKFLPKSNSLSYDTFKEREFILSVKNPKDHINNLYYEKSEDLLHIYLGAKEKIEEKDLKLTHSHPFDLIFTLNAFGLEYLGKAFEYNPDLFFEVPVINIDNRLENENFGQINLVDITSSSVSEIVMELIDFLDRNLLTQDIATWILSGVIDATDNFQSSKTTPRTFNNAALLINRGGNQQEIIRYFYKTKSLDFLRLWGLVLHELSWDEEKKLVWGRIKQEDFQKTNTGPECLPQIFEEIKMAFPERKTAILLWQATSDKEIRGTIYSQNSELLRSLAPKLNGTLKNNNLFFPTRGPMTRDSCRSGLTFDGRKFDNLDEAEGRVLDLINEEF